MAIDWDDLRVFLAVARAGGLSGAGKRLALDAATVGRRVARMEEALGQRLFVKSPQGYALTDEGARLVAPAEAAEAAHQAAEEALSRPETGGGLSGQIRLGAPDGCANYLLPQVLAQLSRENPALEVQLVAMPRVISLSKREADLVIGVSRPEAGRLIVQKITDYHLSLAAHPDYLAAHPPITQLADLRDHRFVGYIPDMILDKELDYLATLGLSGVAMASNSVSVQLQMLRAGAGVGVVHDFARPFAPELRPVLTGDLRLTRAYWLLRHESDARSPRIAKVAEALVAAIRREVARLEGYPVQDG